MFPRSGKKLFTTLSGPILGSWANKYRTFWAAQSGEACNIYEVFEDGTFNLLGQTVLPGNPVRFRANGNQLIVCAGGSVYIATGTAFFRPIISYATAVVNINGQIVTWLSGSQFTNANQAGVQVNPGDLVLLPPTNGGPSSVAPYLYTVASVESATQLTLTESAGTLNSYAMQLGTDMLTGVMPEYLDGYFIVNQPSSKTFWISQIEDGTTWYALDFATKSGSVDNIAAPISFSGYLALIGDTDSSELWADSGNNNFPFQRVSGMSINVGTAAPWSVARFTNGMVVWLLESDGGEHQIVVSAGGAPQRISNHALENALRSYGRIDDAIGATYLENGHEFYRIDFPAAKKTWEFDWTSRVWCELGVSTQEDEVYACDPGRYRVHVTWPSGQPMDLAGDYQSGKIWQISPDFTTDDGVEFPTMRVAPHINTQLEWMNSPEFALDCELGTVDPTLLGPDGKQLIPTVSMEYSDDGGNTWTDAGAASVGRAGEFEGTFLRESESFDTTPGSQTNPQVFEPLPHWMGLGGFWIARTYKIKSTGSALKAIYNGLASISK